MSCSNSQNEIRPRLPPIQQRPKWTVVQLLFIVVRLYALTREQTSMVIPESICRRHYADVCPIFHFNQEHCSNCSFSCGSFGAVGVYISIRREGGGLMLPAVYIRHIQRHTHAVSRPFFLTCVSDSLTTATPGVCQSACFPFRSLTALRTSALDILQLYALFVVCA